MFVLNNALRARPAQPERHRDRPRRVDHGDLPYDAIVYLKAVNEGVPLVLSSPKSTAALRFHDLADTVLGKTAEAAAASTNGAEPAPKKERRGLFGRR